MIPLDPIGYAVSADGTIHTRYATHGEGTRTRTEKGVLTLLDGSKPEVCDKCYPHPRYKQPAPSEPQKRRVPSKAAKAIGKNGGATEMQKIERATRALATNTPSDG